MNVGYGGVYGEWRGRYKDGKFILFNPKSQLAGYQSRCCYH